MKIGPIEERELMTELLRRLAGLVDGVVMINAPSRMIVDASGARRSVGTASGQV